MKTVRVMLDILQGKAIVLTKKDKHKANVFVGKNVDSQFAISSMVGAVKAMLL